MLQGKNIVIIGGTTGLGLSAARAFVKHGAKVVIVGRDRRNCEMAEKELGPNGKVLVGDATHDDTADRAIEIIYESFGGFDGLYHVAGGSGRKYGDGPIHEMTQDAWNKTLELNLTSVMLSSKAAIRYFLENGKAGVILNMTSVLGFSPSPNYFTTHAYSAAKSAIVGLTKSMAAFYANKNIRINAIAPGLVETPMSERASNDERIRQFIKCKQPLEGGRFGRPEDLDGMVSLLMSDQAAFITGQVFTIDGGWTITDMSYFSKPNETE